MRPSFSALTILVCALGSPVSAAPIDQARADNRDADGSPTHIEARILDIGTVLNNVAKGAGSLVNNVVSKAAILDVLGSVLGAFGHSFGLTSDVLKDLMTDNYNKPILRPGNGQ